MSAKHVALVIMFLAHALLGALYGQYALDDYRSDAVLRAYIFTISALSVWWTWLDIRQHRPDVSYFWLAAPALLHFFGVWLYLAVTRPEGSWRRWLVRGILFAASCIFVFGQMFTWMSERAGLA